MADKQTVNRIADALAAHQFDDWYHALLSAALDEHKGDVAKAIAAADATFEANPKAPAVTPQPGDAAAVFGDLEETDDET